MRLNPSCIIVRIVETMEFIPQPELDRLVICLKLGILFISIGGLNLLYMSRFKIVIKKLS